MRSLFAISALVAAVAAQSESFGFSSTRAATTDIEVEPTQTETVSGPINTARACSQIAEYVDRSDLEFPSVEAELAYACLQSVPIDTEAASFTIDSLKQMIQFHSTLSYLKNPPETYANEAVDIVGGLDDIQRRVNNGDYGNEYDFENDVASLFIKAHDGHLVFDGMAYGGTFRWRRNRRVALVSGSSDGQEIPKVWAIQDYNQTGSADFTPSPVVQIDGIDVVRFLQEEGENSAYHDPDTRWNAMFFMQPAENYGYFTNPRFYPGPSVNVTFENGTTFTYPNSAIVLDTNAWSYVTDADSFYETFIVPTTSLKRMTKRRAPHSLPRHLENPRETELSKRWTPTHYPDSVIQHSADDVGLAGYFIDTSAGTVGVLMIQTFNTADAPATQEFQLVVQEYIRRAQSRNIQKHIIDVRANGGGKILLGYDTYLQFFPTQDPQLMSRYRGHQASELIGESVSSYRELTLLNGDLYTTPFNYRSYLDQDGAAFDGWSDMYPPERFNDDNFTALLRYNLSDPLVTSSTRYSIGIEMTGYGDRSNFTSDPFKPEDIIILSDGICASTCSLFTELMVQQSGVKTLAIGGRPSTGPMQPVGGTKGSLVLQSQFLVAVSAYVLNQFAGTRSRAQEWAAFLPNPFGIAVNDANINFQDNIRKGREQDGIPAQFLNDTASCRVWYQPHMYLNVTSVWERAAQVAFGNQGGLDEGACVPGSVTSLEQQQGRGDGNPATGTGNGNTQPSESKGAAAGLLKPQGSWGAIVACGAVVVTSMAVGASLI
ncbi:hypothetical protein BS50DRAFT_22919 [Corynespora cassiicola Philippines]|uniref:Uncharacterized protein n=1 Tax=Corynespora cassiicola Philippines TaxID=1448308 RepID=A0A2T2PAQ0_CORCC|nr:hypothetical protein BS50DRAFT_22919 [Corynespora cassiicola Philippines]